jgi:ribosomal-protein-alanine N-acetyltransferase
LKYEMKFIFTPTNEKYANDIANWHYDDVYSFYDMAADEDDLRILMDTKNWQNTIKAVLNEDDELAGWASFYTQNDEFWLSLGLGADLTGQGLGEEFVSECVKYAVSGNKLVRNTIKLAVALFNQRAIKVYQRAGFVETNKIIRDTHIGQVDFIEMEKQIAH